MRPEIKRQTFDKERVSWNTAWMKRFGHHFEIVVDPDLATRFRAHPESVDIKEVVRSEKVFFHAQTGELAEESAMIEAFQTTDPLVIAKRLITEGELQLSAEYRAEARERKRNAILAKLQAYAVDPTTGLPHPAKRIELALEEAKVRIDDNQDVERQLPEIVRELQPIIPIRLETAVLQVHLPAPWGQKLYGDLSRFGTLKRTEWLGDGALLAFIEMPAGLQPDFIGSIGTKTHGAAEIHRVEENRLR